MVDGGGAVGWARRARAATGEASRRWRDAARQQMDAVPVVVRGLGELARVEVVDRATSIGAQALLALIPMLVILAAFFPHLIGEGTQQLAAVTGLGRSGEATVQDTVAGTAADVSQVRAATGVVGLVVVVFSASSFARSLQRCYVRLWDVPGVRGVVARRRCLSWLVGWLVAMQLLGVVGAWVSGPGMPLLDPVWDVLRWALLVLLWWWTIWALLLGRIPRQRLLLPAVVCASGLVAYSWGSGLVMPRYVVSSAEQFGSLGVVLAVASWLVGAGFVIVVAATLGKVLDEDDWVRAAAARITRRLRVRRTSSPDATSGP